VELQVGGVRPLDQRRNGSFDVARASAHGQPRYRAPDNT
jgi:hypothetical protein